MKIVNWKYKDDEHLCADCKYMYSMCVTVNGGRVECTKLDYYTYTDCVYTLTMPARKECEYYER